MSEMMTTPVFKHLPDRTRVIFFAVFLPLGYFILVGVLGPVAMALVQVSVLFLPSLWFLGTHQLVHGLERENFLKNLLGTVIMTVLLSITLHLVLPWWERIFPPPRAFEEALTVLMHRGQSWGWLRDILELAVLPAVCEETFFRGVMLISLLAYFQPRVAIAVTAFFFAAYHLNPWNFVFYFILGVYFGWLYFKVRHLGLVILAHLINNVVAVTIYHYFE